MLAVALGLQAATAAGPVLPVGRCRPTAVGEVVVCARRPADNPYRLKPLPPPPDPAHRDPLAFQLPGGGSGRVHAIETRLPTATGQGLAVTLVKPFGRKPKQ